ncbi:MAG: NADH:ubiquinone reductase (Na(+)-transporting) subunit B [Bacteriovoracaceae bacterium]|nr:NADH:ubiquinone reductase (Na(+)-transporting) subunit B [Bacteriovoracaceae bacterium]
MKFIRNLFDKQEAHFVKGGKLARLYPLYEAIDTFLFTSGEVNRGTTHVRDSIDLKRLMSMVIIALTPCIIMGMYNTGFLANSAISAMNLSEVPGWRAECLLYMGLGFDPTSIIGNIIHGLLYFLPIFIVTNIAGLSIELLFSVVRKHEINEGFLVTGMLMPMIVPASIPLWQVAVAVIFAVTFAKEVFGGTGKNFLNPALAARAFLFFAYPGEISGDAVWVAVDGHTGATALSQLAAGGTAALTDTWWDAFLGFIPGSFGETSTLACLLGAMFLIYTGIGSWRIMLSVLVGMITLSFLFNIIGSDTNPMFAVGPSWHLVTGGFAFGTVFMATDPVTAATTNMGKYYYGLLIGFMVVLVRVINPAFPEGMMLAILFGNLFAPIIDYFVVESNIKRRELKNGIR